MFKPIKPKPIGRWLLVVLVCVLGPGNAAAGPWTKQTGEVYVKLGEGFFLSDSFVNAQGITQKGADYLGLMTTLYAEVGLPWGFQFQGLFPYVVGINSFDDGTDGMRAGLGDLLLSLQYSLPKAYQPIPWGLRFEVKVPMYDVGSRVANAELFPAIGDGQLDVSLYGTVGASLHPLPLFVWGEFGYRFRTEAFVGRGPSDDRSFRDSAITFVQLGWKFFRNMSVAVNFNGVWAVADDQFTKTYLTVGPALYIPIWKGLAFEANVDPVVYARNSAPGIGFGFGLSYAR